MSEVVYFELNDWFAGRDYPVDGSLKQFVEEYLFSKDDWCRDNKLCVRAGNIDMSVNWCITAPRDWVEQKCPELLGDDSYTYVIMTHGRGGTYKTEYKEKYSSFLRYEDEFGRVFGRFDWPFLEYTTENLGVTHYEEDDCNFYRDDDDDEDE